MNNRLRAFPEIRHEVTDRSIQEYAELSGDYNPLHTNPEYAAASRFGSVVAHGPLGLQTVFETVTTWLGVETLPAGAAVEAAYLAPVRPGDAVTSRVEDVLEHAGTLVLEVTCTNQRDEAVIEALVSVPRHLAPKSVA
jgi:phosphate acetyltransferase/phosphate butyryltransferase